MAVKIVTLNPVTITTGGVAEQAGSAATPVTSMTLQAEDTNTGNVYIGGSNVTAANGQALTPGNTCEITADSIGRGSAEEFLINEVWINSSTSGNVVRIAVFQRRN